MLDSATGSDLLGTPGTLSSLMGPLLASARFNSEVHAVWGISCIIVSIPSNLVLSECHYYPKCGVFSLVETHQKKPILAWVPPPMMFRVFEHYSPTPCVGISLIQEVISSRSAYRRSDVTDTHCTVHTKFSGHWPQTFPQLTATSTVKPCAWSVLSRKRLSVQVCRHAWHLSGQSCVLIRSLMHMQLHATET